MAENSVMMVRLTMKMPIAMIRYLQINLNGASRAHDLMEDTVVKLGIDIVLINELYRMKSEEEGWFCDSARKAAVVVANPNISVTDIGQGADLGFRWICAEDIRIYSCYWSPNTNLSD